MPIILAVYLGGIIGTALRFGVDVALPHEASTVGWSTIIVNIVGSFVLALLTTTAWRTASFPAWAKAGLGAGVLGSFTTYSAVAIGTALAALSGHVEIAFINLSFSLLFGLFAAALGIAVGNRIFKRPRSGTTIVDEGVDL